MNKLKKFIIGALLTVAIAGIGFKITSRKNDSARTAKEISFENPQAEIDQTYRIASPQNIDKIIYDPEFKESDSYIKIKMHSFSNEDIAQSMLNSRASSGHNMGVIGVLEYMGDGLKRPAFARKELFTSPEICTLEDIASIIKHEDVHAGEERYGLDFRTHRKKGDEVLRLLNSKSLRLNMMLTIGETGAFAEQIEEFEAGKRKPSKALKRKAYDWIKYLSTMIETEISNGTLNPVEKEYYQAKKTRYDSVFKKL